MKFQSRKFSCGSTALGNALEVYGIFKSEEYLSEVCKTNINGTSSAGLRAGIQAVGCSAIDIKLRDASEARKKLEECLVLGHPVILCVDDWSHWVALVGHINSKAIIADSASVHLVEYFKWPDLMTRWKHYGSRYHGVIVEPPVVTLSDMYKEPYDLPPSV
jgi:ABC-type bacteriocin/lantibiotic exporter with double-glycine peptidase domain